VNRSKRPLKKGKIVKEFKLPRLKVWRAKWIMRISEFIQMDKMFNVDEAGDGRERGVEVMAKVLLSLAKLDLSPAQADKIVRWALKHPRRTYSLATPRGDDAPRLMALYSTLSDRVTCNTSLGRSTYDTAYLFSKVHQALRSGLTVQLLSWIGWAGEQYFGVERVHQPNNLVDVSFLRELRHGAGNLKLYWMFQGMESTSVALNHEAISYMINDDILYHRTVLISNVRASEVELILTQERARVATVLRRLPNMSHWLAVVAVEQLMAMLEAAGVSILWSASVDLYEGYRALRGGASGVLGEDILRILRVCDKSALVSYLASDHYLLYPSPELVPEVVAMAQLRFPNIWLSQALEQIAQCSWHKIEVGQALVEAVPGLASVIVGVFEQTDVECPERFRAIYEYIRERVEAVAEDKELTWALFHDWDRTRGLISLSEFCAVRSAQDRLHESNTVV
jgi:hypothetical protein